jgi:adenine-specific DNA-methyltransferase
VQISGTGSYGEKMPSVIEIDGRRGANELRKLFPEIATPFKNPKTYTLIEWLLSFAAKKDAVVLDPFAGSGTTAQSVAALNARDNGTRKFILIQLPEELPDDSPARKIGFKEIIDVTVERVRRALRGVPNSKDAALKHGLGGSFSYCELGEPIELERFFDGKGAPSYEQVARYVVYTATGQSADAPAEPRKDWFVAEVGGYRLHLIYRPELTFMRTHYAALSLEMAKQIEKSAKGKPVLVYAAAKFVSQTDLKHRGITFCQLPYSVHRVLGEAPDAP